MIAKIIMKKYLTIAFIGMILAISLVSCDGPKTPPGIDYDMSVSAITDGSVELNFEHGYILAGGDAHMFAKATSEGFVPYNFTTKADILAKGDKAELEALRLANEWAQSVVLKDSAGGHYDITINAYLHERLTGLTLQCERHWDNNTPDTPSCMKTIRHVAGYTIDNDPYPYIF